MVNDLFDLAMSRVGYPARAQLKSKKILLAQEIKDHAQTFAAGPLPQAQFYVEYFSHPLIDFDGDSLIRPFARFDFHHEWNNRGYGQITTEPNSPYSVSEVIHVLPETPHTKLAVVKNYLNEVMCDYAVTFVHAGCEYLWFNRAVGPIDGYDWSIVENFLTRSPGSSLPCVSEIPYGYAGAVTMRIDCDEAVASGRPLFELYKKHAFPFSLAIKTDQALAEPDFALMRDVIAAGGSVVGHSHSHAPDWGGSAQKAQWEVAETKKSFAQMPVSGLHWDFAVSPFHQNSLQSVQGLEAAGLRAFASGISCNDPDYLMARAGVVQGTHRLISHSQQCMLHGETYIAQNENLQEYKNAFLQAFKTKTFFGFLDHPFSSYHYGWLSEEQRLKAHKDFLEFILQIPSLWLASLVDALRFFEMKSRVKIVDTENNFQISLDYNASYKDLPSVQIFYKLEKYELKAGNILVLQK